MINRAFKAGLLEMNVVIIVHVIDPMHRIAPLQQSERERRTDKSCSSGDEDIAHWQDAEKLFVTPAKAGVQNIRTDEISNRLDSGLRRNDGFGCFSDFFSILLDVLQQVDEIDNSFRQALLEGDRWRPSEF